MIKQLSKTLYSSLHVGLRQPGVGLTTVWKDSNIEGPALAAYLRQVANEVEELYAQDQLTLASTGIAKEEVLTKRQAEAARKREEKIAAKQQRQEEIKTEQEWFARGGLKEQDGTIIYDPDAE